MKKKLVLTGIITLLLVFGMAVMSCGDKETGDPTSPNSGDSGWPEVTVPATTLAGALLWLGSNNVTNQTNYIIELAGNESIGHQTLGFPFGKSVTIILRGGSSEKTVSLIKTVSLSSDDSLFTIRSGVKLVLDSNVTLQGLSGNNDSLVKLHGGTLVMNDGSKITGNDNTSYGGGGVLVVEGTFTMSGGTISGNTAPFSGGVNVVSGMFTMLGGTISGNTASGSYGGGVGGGGTFTMSGGTISGNTASGSYGGGVEVGGGTFTMSGGTISGNTASSQGGGVGAGGGTFAMSGGTISNNTAYYYGGGVFGTLTMTGGTISGNTASSDGGGVCGKLIKTGGSSITSTNSAPTGKVAYVSSSQKRETAAGPGVNLDYRVSGLLGGWE
ncbi:hypothetical protein AGMMS49940_13680 [Spirochaetia bacterium]|nr:hypothetical protein AGMMS49940_13680 [Spirochaetia bacterium]